MAVKVTSRLMVSCTSSSESRARWRSGSIVLTAYPTKAAAQSRKSRNAVAKRSGMVGGSLPGAASGRHRPVGFARSGRRFFRQWLAGPGSCARRLLRDNRGSCELGCDRGRAKGQSDAGDVAGVHHDRARRRAGVRRRFPARRQVADRGGRGARPVDPSKATFEVTPEGRSARAVGCNRIVGKPKIDGQSIAFGPMAGTRMACPPPLDQIEAKYMAALEAARTFRHRGRDADVCRRATAMALVTLKRAN